MKKQLVFIETDAGFIQNFENNLKKEGLDTEFQIIQLMPEPGTKKNHSAVIKSCFAQVIEMYEQKNNIYGIFVDICIIDGESTPLGIDIAKQLRIRFPQLPIFNITNKTQYDSEFDSLSEAGLENIDGVLVKSYLEGDNFSKERFNKIFEKAHNKRAYTRDNSLSEKSTHQVFDIAIICATAEPEFKSIKAIIQNLRAVNKEQLKILDNTIYFEGLMNGKNNKLRVIAASEDKMGMPALSSLATRMITNFRPKYLVILGIAAGIEGETNIGDILIPEFSWDYGSGKLEIDNKTEFFRPYINQIKLDENLRNIFVNYKSNTILLNKIRESYPQPEESILKLFVGPFASGAAVIASERFVVELKVLHKKLIGFDMEVYAVFSSAEAFPTEIKPKVIAVKSVSDFGTSKKSNPLKKHHQTYAAYTSSQFFKEFVENEL
jgi:nucleoside phosphorylase